MGLGYDTKTYFGFLERFSSPRGTVDPIGVGRMVDNLKGVSYIGLDPVLLKESFEGVAEDAERAGREGNNDMVSLLKKVFGVLLEPEFSKYVLVEKGESLVGLKERNIFELARGYLSRIERGEDLSEESENLGTIRIARDKAYKSLRVHINIENRLG